MPKNPSLSFIELSKENLVHNIKQFRSLAKKGTKISVAIKGNAYGHGQNHIAKILDPYVDYFQIDSIAELELLRKVSVKKTFLMGYVKKSELSKALKLGCILSVLSLMQLKELNKIAGKLKIKQEIQIPIDAYLGREGFLLSDLREVFTEIKNCSYLKLAGIYAHFANIEDTRSFTHAQKQINEYRNALDLAQEFGFFGIHTHISATSGLLAYEKNEGVHTVIRLGVGVYGMWPSEDILKMYKNKITLKPALSWKTKVAQVKILPKNHTIGYGLTYTTKKETKIAIIPQGYADGYDRGLSNKGEVLIGGTRCAVLGRISMNMFAVDVSHLPKVKEEDEVVILGSQGGEEITALEIAKKIDTINYEVTTRISSLLPRVVV
ncbi:MAG: alanine racemase [bacterium]